MLHYPRKVCFHFLSRPQQSDRFAGVFSFHRIGAILLIVLYRIPKTLTDCESVGVLCYTQGTSNILAPPKDPQLRIESPVLGVFVITPTYGTPLTKPRDLHNPLPHIGAYTNILAEVPGLPGMLEDTGGYWLGGELWYTCEVWMSCLVVGRGGCDPCGRFESSLVRTESLKS